MHIAFHNDATAADVATAIVGFAILLSLRRFSDLIWYVCSVFRPLSLSRFHVRCHWPKELYHTQLLNFMLVLFNALF